MLSFPASELVTRPPTIPPIDPPTAINPKSRLPCDRCENVSHERPKHCCGEKIEDADPDEKYGRKNHAFLRCWHPTHEKEENKKVRNGETVRDRNKSSPRHTRDDDGIKRVSDQHTDQRAGVHPRQIFNAAVGADLIADWPDNVITAENDKVEDKCQPECANLVRLYVNDFGEDVFSCCSRGPVGPRRARRTATATISVSSTRQALPLRAPV